MGELLTLALRQLAEDVHRIRAGISDLGGDEVLAGEDGDGELGFVGGAGHVWSLFTMRARIADSCKP